MEEKYDCIIVGSGPNGLAAAITLQQQGLSTLLLEGGDKVGGGMRTEQLTLSGFRHDVCSAIHPMAMLSPFFKNLPLKDFGLEFIHTPIVAAHPLLGRDTVFLHKDLKQTSNELGEDRKNYEFLLGSLINDLNDIVIDALAPLRFPRHPWTMAKFGLKALPPATWIARLFKTERGKALWAGMVAHALQPLDNWATSAYGLMLLGAGHEVGWPIPIGGSQAIADALLGYYRSIGGEFQTDFWLKDRAKLPLHNLLVLNMTPQQILDIQGLDLDVKYRIKLQNYRQGMGVFKIDWALSDPTPFVDKRCMQASTVHIGGTFAEIAESEYSTYVGKMSETPFVLFSQPSLFDSKRAPDDKHVAWAYCHVPHGSSMDCTELIENQIERFAPGFKDTILAKSTMNTMQLQDYNPNYIGGDINGGLMDIRQLYTRPVFSLTPYRTSDKNVYIASSSTPPGGGVHGLCGYYAAQTILKDHYGLDIKL